MARVFEKFSTALALIKNRDVQEIRERIARNLHLIRREDRVRHFWDSHESVPGLNWWEITAVQRRWDKLITGESDTILFEWVRARYLVKLQPRRALSFCCGDGGWEREWMKHYHFEEVHGIDISPNRIERAREAAALAGYTGWHYEIGDANTITLPADYYDVVLVKQALHHIQDLEHALFQLRNSLRPSGLLILHDFVGPSRFQWTDRQLEVVNGALAVLPHKYRRSVFDPSKLKDKVSKPEVSSMLQRDPSEACRSEEIPSLVRKYFEILEWREWGGTVLHLLLHEIAGNFSGSEESRLVLGLCFAIEDTLLAIGDLSSDFIFAIGRPAGLVLEQVKESSHAVLGD